MNQRSEIQNDDTFLMEEMQRAFKMGKKNS